MRDADGTLVSQTSGSDVMWYHTDGNGETIGFTLNASVYFYMKNAQGDVIGITDNAGNILATYEYDTWGKLLSTGGSNATLAAKNPLRYRGYEYDTETGLYYLGARYYDPTVGRFLNADSPSLLGASAKVTDKNFFAYCDNNPIVRIDNGGNIWETILDIGCVVSSAIDFANEPSLGNAGILGLDVAGALIPFVPSAAATVPIKAAKAGSKAVKTAEVAKRVEGAAEIKKILNNTGWKLGDDITALTKAGNAPSWSTVRARYWKNDAFFNPTKYSNDFDNFLRAKRGLAPQVGGISMELHHINGRNILDPHNINNLLPLTQADHRLLHKLPPIK